MKYNFDNKTILIENAKDSLAVFEAGRKLYGEDDLHACYGSPETLKVKNDGRIFPKYAGPRVTEMAIAGWKAASERGDERLSKEAAAAFLVHLGLVSETDVLNQAGATTYLVEQGILQVEASTIAESAWPQLEQSAA